MAVKGENNKEVIVSIKGDNSSLNESIQESNQKLQDLGNTEIPNKSVKEFKNEIKSLAQEIGEAEDKAYALQKAGKFNTQEYRNAIKEVASLRHEQEKLDTAVQAFNPANRLSAFVGVANGAAVAVQGYAGAMQFLGVNSDDAMQSIAKLQGLMAFTDALSGIDNIKNSFKSLGLLVKGMIPSFTGANIASKALGFSLKALGIGLITAAIAYLIENFQTIKETVLDFIPELGNLSGMFDKVKQVAMGVGNALIKYLSAPIKAIISVIHGDFKGALNNLKDGFSVVKNFKEGEDKYTENQEKKHQAELAKQREEVRKKEEAKQKEHQRKLQAERDRAHQEALQKQAQYLQQKGKAEDTINQYITDNEKKLRQAHLTAQQIELEDAKEQYDNLLAEAQKYGLNITALTATYNANVAAINKKYADKAKQEAQERASKQQIDNLGRVSDKAQANVIDVTGNNIVTATDTPDTAKQKILNIANAQVEAENAAFELKKAQALQENKSLELIEAQHQDTILKIQQDAGEKIKSNEQAVADFKMATYQKTGEALGALSEIAGKNTVVGKALAIAQATINTYTAATQILAAQTPPLIPPPVALAMKIASMVSVIASGLAQVKQIASVKVPHASDSTSAPSAPRLSIANATAPVVTSTSNENQVQDVRVVNQEKQEPIRAYITDKDLSKSQDRTNLYNSLATL